MKSTTDKLVDLLNRKRGLTHPMVGYCYFADIAGNGDNRKAVYQITNAQGGVAYAHDLNARSPLERCAKIRRALEQGAPY